jgi:septal ring factor EnvC (AmiA/AmiB activator)
VQESQDALAELRCSDAAYGKRVAELKEQLAKERQAKARMAARAAAPAIRGGQTPAPVSDCGGVASGITSLRPSSSGSGAPDGFQQHDNSSHLAKQVQR